MLLILLEAHRLQKKRFYYYSFFENGGYLKINEIQHNKTLLRLYFTDEI